MSSRRLGLSYRFPFLFLFGLAMAFVASGCMWGVVRDARTGAGVPDASVMYFDSNGNTRSTFTDSNGVYYFDASEPAAAMGEATFVVMTKDKGTEADRRVIDYAENPNATLVNPTSFWEVQTFEVPGEPGSYHDAKQGYSMEFPLDWVVAPSPEPSEDELISEAIAMGFEEDFAINICMIESGPLPPSGFPEKWWRDAPEDMRVTERGTTEIAGTEAARLGIALKMEGDDAKGLLYAFERVQQGWIIVCITEADHFTKSAATFESIAKSLKFD